MDESACEEGRDEESDGPRTRPSWSCPETALKKRLAKETHMVVTSFALEEA